MVVLVALALVEIAAVVAVVLLAGVTLFQAALALGAPLGTAAWGGRYAGVLPKRLRIASGVAALVVYPVVILLVLASASLIAAKWLPGIGKTSMWILTGLFTLGALANIASRSKVERLWGPVCLGLAACCGIIASSY